MFPHPIQIRPEDCVTCLTRPAGIGSVGLGTKETEGSPRERLRLYKLVLLGVSYARDIRPVSALLLTHAIQSHTFILLIDPTHNPQSLLLLRICEHVPTRMPADDTARFLHIDLMYHLA